MLCHSKQIDIKSPIVEYALVDATQSIIVLQNVDIAQTMTIRSAVNVMTA